MLGERGNIVAEKLCFRKCLPTHRKLAEFAAREAKMFPIKFRNIFLAGTMFLPSWPYVSSTMRRKKYQDKMAIRHVSNESFSRASVFIFPTDNLKDVMRFNRRLSAMFLNTAYGVDTFFVLR